MSSLIAGAILGFLSFKDSAPAWENLLRISATCVAATILYLIGKGVL